MIAICTIGAESCGSNGRSEAESLVVEGEVTSRGNEPFAEYILETSDGELFVLNLSDSLRARLVTPSRLEVRGRSYEADWQGRAYKHLDVESWTEAE